MKCTVSRGRAGRVARVVPHVHPTLGTVVMASGIVSTALFLAGFHLVSGALLALAAVSWASLAVALVADLVRSPREVLRREGTTPAALTGVAGTAVLADRLLVQGWEPAAIALLVIAAALWLALLGPILTHWSVPTTGASFLLPVSTLSLALALGTLANAGRPLWCLAASALLLLPGLVAYGVVLARFEARQLLVGHGDHWVAGGALALSALVTARIAQGLGAGGLPDRAVALAALGLLALALAWLPVLVACELRAPRTSYHVGRFATVFPLGMYAVAGFVVGAADGIGAIEAFASVWTWLAFGAWVAVVGALVTRTVAHAVARRG
jgi:tellurite resistance protein TehA-like permease